MKVDDSTKLQSPPRGDLEKLKRQKQNLVNGELSEIEKLKSYYAGKKEIVKKDSEGELETVKDAQKKEYLEALSGHQESLLKKAEDYKTLEKNLDESRKQLIASEKAELDNLRMSYKDNMEMQYKNALESADDMTRHTDHIIVKARLDSDRSLSSGQKQFGEQLDNQAMAHANQIKNKENIFKLSQNGNDIEQSKILLSQKHKHQQLMDNDKILAHNKISTQKNLYSGQMETEKAQYEARLKQQKESFLQRFQSLQEAHDKVINDTSNKLGGEYHNTASSLVQTKAELESRAQDPFYRPSVLSPQIKDEGKHYLISVKVPEHEKEMVTFNAHQRALKINMTRKFSQDVVLPDGSSNKSKRSEIFAKEFAVAEIVDPKTILQKYENGTLTFRIAKV